MVCWNAMNITQTCFFAALCLYIHDAINHIFTNFNAYTYASDRVKYAWLEPFSFKCCEWCKIIINRSVSCEYVCVLVFTFLCGYCRCDRDVCERQSTHLKVLFDNLTLRATCLRCTKQLSRFKRYRWGRSSGLYVSKTLSRFRKHTKKCIEII